MNEAMTRMLPARLPVVVSPLRQPSVWDKNVLGQGWGKVMGWRCGAGGVWRWERNGFKLPDQRGLSAVFGALTEQEGIR